MYVIYIFIFIYLYIYIFIYLYIYIFIYLYFHIFIYLLLETSKTIEIIVVDLQNVFESYNSETFRNYTPENEHGT